MSRPQHAPPGGRGVLRAARNVSGSSRAILGRPPAAARAAALELGVPSTAAGATLLPVPVFNILDGGAHADC